jgi:hypothetical protein
MLGKEIGHKIVISYFFLMEQDFMFRQGSVDLQEWILLDNQSTVNVFCNPKLVKNIRKAPQALTLHCNAGAVNVTQMADLPGYPEPVWFHSKGIANVLSLSKVSKLFAVTFDNQNGFIIHKPDGKQHQFKESPCGLFYLDTTGIIGHEDAIMVMTVEQKKAGYSNQDYKKAELTRKVPRCDAGIRPNVCEQDTFPHNSLSAH